jgi:hypothetical protein
MRRYQLAKGREFYRALGMLHKEQKEARQRGDDVEAIGEPVEWVQSTDPGPGEPDITGVGCVQTTDTNPSEPVGCAEPSPASPSLQGTIPGDETNPIPPEQPGDETNPIPAETPAPAAGQPTLEEYLEAVTARLDPSGPLPPPVREALRAPSWRSMS